MLRSMDEVIPEAKNVLAAAGYAQVIEHIEAERDRYKAALERILSDMPQVPRIDEGEVALEIAEEALGDQT